MELITPPSEPKEPTEPLFSCALLYFALLLLLPPPFVHRIPSSSMKTCRDNHRQPQLHHLRIHRRYSRFRAQSSAAKSGAGSKLPRRAMGHGKNSCSYFKPWTVHGSTWSVSAPSQLKSMAFTTATINQKVMQQTQAFTFVKTVRALAEDWPIGLKNRPRRLGRETDGRG